MENDLRRAFISTVQSALGNRGFDPGPVDGDLGPNTLDAVRAFQQTKGLPVTGRLNPETMDALDVGAPVALADVISS
jgi:localization factor PodJL